MKKSFLIVLITGLFFQIQAQRGWEAGGWLGVSNYFGDLNTNLRVDRVGPAGGLALRYNFNERVCFKLGANAGRVQADDADSDNGIRTPLRTDHRTALLAVTRTALRADHHTGRSATLVAGGLSARGCGAR